MAWPASRSSRGAAAAAVALAVAGVALIAIGELQLSARLYLPVPSSPFPSSRLLPSFPQGNVAVAGLNGAARDELLVAKAKTQKLAEPQQRQFAVYQVCVWCVQGAPSSRRLREAAAARPRRICSPVARAYTGSAASPVRGGGHDVDR